MPLATAQTALASQFAAEGLSRITGNDDTCIVATVLPSLAKSDNDRNARSALC
jgi:hypothetical protein